MEQFDIKEFAQMFDAALASDNPTVKKALRNFMMVAAIVHAEEQNGEERLMGPLETLVKKVADLEAIVYKMQNERNYKDNYYKDYYNNPTWVYAPNTSTTSGTIKGTKVDKVWADELSSFKDILKDIKIT